MWLLIRTKIKILANSVRQLKVKKSLFFIFLGFGFLFLLGYFFWRIFRYLYFLEDFPYDLKIFLLLKLLSLIFMAVFVLVLISALLLALEIFFISRDVHLLLATPFKLKKIFSFKIIDVFLHAIAVPLFFSFPMLFALALYFAPSFIGLLQIFFIFFVFIFCAALIGISLAMLIPLFASIRRVQPYISLLSVALLSLLVIFLRLSLCW